MYLDEAAEIFAYLERNPPVYQITAIIAQMLGWKPARHDEGAPAFAGVNSVSEPAALAPNASVGGATAPHTQAVDLQALMAVPGVAHQRTPDWARGAVLDFEELKRLRTGAQDG
jgi:hypothetical protein